MFDIAEIRALQEEIISNLELLVPLEECNANSVFGEHITDDLLVADGEKGSALLEKSVVNYICASYPTAEVDAQGRPIDNRVQSCINAVSSFVTNAQQNEEKTDIQSKILLIAEIIYHINCAINICKIRDKTREELNEPGIIASFDDDIKKILSLIIDHLKKLNVLYENRADLTTLANKIEDNILKDEWEYIEGEEEEEKEEFVHIDSGDSIPLPNEKEARRLSVTEINRYIQEKIGKHGNRELLPCIEVDAAKPLAMQPELTSTLGKIEEYFSRDQNITSVVIPSAVVRHYGPVSTRHLCTYVFERSEDKLIIYEIDSKPSSQQLFQQFMGYIPEWILTKKSDIESLLSGAFASEFQLEFRPIFLGQQGFADNTLCGYFTLKVINILLENCDNKIEEIRFPAENVNFGTSTNWLTATEIENINRALSEVKEVVSNHNEGVSEPGEEIDVTSEPDARIEESSEPGDSDVVSETREGVEEFCEPGEVDSEQVPENIHNETFMDYILYPFYKIAEFFTWIGNKIADKFFGTSSNGYSEQTINPDVPVAETGNEAKENTYISGCYITTLYSYLCGGAGHGRQEENRVDASLSGDQQNVTARNDRYSL